jgi:NAD(P)H-dependent flavin oxidoreductase YrpB (nitropropane dioxygenase family)
MLLKAGLVEGNTHAGVLAAGQVTGIIEDLPTVRQLIDRIVDDAIARIDAVAALRQGADATPSRST